MYKILLKNKQKLKMVVLQGAYFGVSEYDVLLRYCSSKLYSYDDDFGTQSFR